MCPYMTYFEGKLPVCEPKKNLCTMCVVGNQKIFNEIEEGKTKFSKKPIDKITNNVI